MEQRRRTASRFFPIANPAMQLDFLTAYMPPSVTFTRNSIATVVNEQGLITTVAANVPRFNHNPVTLAPSGLRVEQASTNLLIRSEEFSAVAWIKTASSVTPDNAISPDGTADADLLVEDATNAGHYAAQSISATSGTSYSFSVYAKAATRTFVQLIMTSIGTAGGNVVAGFDLTLGTASTVSSGGTAAITPAGNGWYRCSISVVATATITANQQIRPALSASNTPASYAGDGTSGVLIWGAQMEASIFSTSYIPTTSATVPRVADLPIMTGANFLNWYNQAEGTFLVTGMTDRPFGAGNGGQMLSFGTDASNRIFLSQGPTTYALDVQGQVSGVSTIAINTGGPSAGLTDMRAALAYKANSCFASLNGAAPGSDSNGNIPAAIALYIGNSFTGSAAGNWNGHIRDVKYWQQFPDPKMLPYLTSQYS